METSHRLRSRLTTNDDFSLPHVYDTQNKCNEKENVRIILRVRTRLRPQPDIRVRRRSRFRR